MTKFSELPLETQFLIERCNRSYRKLCILYCRKPTIDELIEELTSLLHPQTLNKNNRENNELIFLFIVITSKCSA